MIIFSKFSAEYDKYSQFPYDKIKMQSTKKYDNSLIFYYKEYIVFSFFIKVNFFRNVFRA